MPYRLVVVLALALLALAVPPAHAVHQDDTYAHAACSFAQLNGTATPGVAAAVPDLPDLLDVDDGRFTLEGELSCAAVDLAGADQAVLPLAPDNLHVEAFGHYDNQICGTATGWGTAKLTDNPISPLFVDIDVSIGFEVVAGSGRIQIVFENEQDGRVQLKPGSPNPDNMVHSGRGAGAIQLTPTSGDCVQNDVTAFTAKGGIELAFAGEADDDIDP